jgi:hypothetical protein
MKEEWRTVSNTDDTYEVSSLGRVRKYLTLHERDGYLRVDIEGKKGKQRRVSVHCLVAAEFIGPCPFGMKVNHIDLDKSNNCYKNLEYMTQLQNIRHAIKNGHGGMGGKLSLKDYGKIQQLFSTSKYSKAELGRRFGVSASAISYALGEIDSRGKRRHVP